MVQIIKNVRVKKKIFLIKGIGSNQREAEYNFSVQIDQLKHELTFTPKNNKVNDLNDIKPIKTISEFIQFHEGYITFKEHKIDVVESKLDYQRLFKNSKFLHSIPIIFSNSNGLYLLETSKEKILKIIEYLKIENKFQFKNFDYPVGEKLPSWNFLSFNYPFKSDKKKCLDTLFTWANHNGYIPEIILNEEMDVIKSEPSLLFIIKRQIKIFIVWESILDLKATYVFQSDNDKFNKQYKNIIDFIGGHHFKNKREGLSKSFKLKKDLGYKSTVPHKSTDNYNAFENWKNGLIKELS